jgi:hypothetical protein
MTERIIHHQYLKVSTIGIKRGKYLMKIKESINNLYPLGTDFYIEIFDKKEITFKYDKLNRITLISKKTNTNISNSKIKYKNLKTIFNKKIYYFNTTGIKTKEEGRD